MPLSAWRGKDQTGFPPSICRVVRLPLAATATAGVCQSAPQLPGQHFHYASPTTFLCTSSPIRILATVWSVVNLNGQWRISRGYRRVKFRLRSTWDTTLCIIDGYGSGICSCPRKWGFGISYSFISFLSTIDLLPLLLLIDNSRLLPLSYTF